MNAEAVLLHAIAADPSDSLAWLALADWLEEDGQADRAELLRLHRRVLAGGKGQGRLRQLLAAGVRPTGPEFVHACGMRFRLIPPGRFRMGAVGGERDGHADERPRHAVTITRPFWMGVYLVTQQQYEALTGSNPSAFRPGARRKRSDSPLLPVERINHDDALAFCRLLGPEYRLPSEAEWEYACRAGTSTRYHFGSELTPHNANANNWQKRPSPVGGFAPNGWGLYDMHGNVWEWTNDWYSTDYYADSPAVDPPGAEGGTSRVMRGGGWGAHPGRVTASCRGTVTPASRDYDNGLRVVRDFVPPAGVAR